MSLLQVATLFVIGAISTAIASTMIWLSMGRAHCRHCHRYCVIYGATLYFRNFAAEVRGNLVSLNQLMITIGIVCSYLADYALAESRGWRWMFGLAAIPAIILFIGLLSFPKARAGI